MFIVRRLARHARFFTLAIFIVALGVATHLAAMVLVESVVLPTRDAATDRLVRPFAAYPGESGLHEGSAPWVDVLRDSRGAFESVAAFSADGTGYAALPGGDPARIRIGVADPALFEILGKRPAMGRAFEGADEPGVVITHRYWRSAFDADPGVLGRTLQIERREYPIVGVLPKGFEGPQVGRQVDVWAPLDLAPTLFVGVIPRDFRERSGFGWLNAVAKLRDDASIEQAQRQIDSRLGPQAVSPAFGPSPDGAKRLPAARLRDFAEASIDPNGTANHRRNAWLVAMLATLALVLSCVNIAGLLSMRGEARQQEVGVRVGLGARPWQIVRVLLDESLVVAVCGLLLGWLVALVALEQILRAPPNWLAIGEFDPLTALLRPELIATTGLLYLAALLLSAGLPLLRASRIKVVDAVRVGGASLGKRRQLMRSAMVCGQFAVTVALLIAGAMLLRSHFNQTRVDLGFAPQGVAVIPVSVAREGLTEADYEPMLRRLRSAVEASDGVASTAWIMSVPVQPGGMRTTVLPVAGNPAAGEPEIETNVVSPGAFAVLGVGLRQGREFGDADTADSRPVVIVNRSFVETYLDGRPALGQRLGGIADERGGVEIVGVVENHKKRSVQEGEIPQIYLPLSQFPMQSMALPSHGAEEASLASVPALLRTLDPDVRVGTPVTLQDHVAHSMRESTSLLVILLSVAGLSSLLAAIGMFAVVDQWFQRRRRELSIRMAVGATIRSLRALVVRQAAGIVIVALALGSVLALLATESLSGLLFQVAPLDPLSHLIAWTITGGLMGSSLLVTLSATAQLSPSEMLKSE
jgi:predicted permease